MVKNPPANAGDIRHAVRSLGHEDLLEEKMITHSSILAWAISRTEKPSRLQSTGLRKNWTRLRARIHRQCLKNKGKERKSSMKPPM